MVVTYSYVKNQKKIMIQFCKKSSKNTFFIHFWLKFAQNFFFKKSENWMSQSREKLVTKELTNKLTNENGLISLSFINPGESFSTSANQNLWSEFLKFRTLIVALLNVGVTFYSTAIAITPTSSSATIRVRNFKRSDQRWRI